MSQGKEGTGKWKSRLIQSGLPLEFEVAKLLAKKRFSIDADFTYARDDAGIMKDFSVDIEATSYTPFNSRNAVTSEISLLIECKHRNPATKWVFLPDPNSEHFPQLTRGNTLNALDAFSLYRVEIASTVDFDRDMPLCYKGVEVIENGDVFDKEIKHGVLQLQYALPRLYTKGITIWGGALEDGHPFFFCAILLTNAELIVADKGVTVSSIEKADRVQDLGRSTPYFVLRQDYGPDFERHCIKECAPLTKLAQEQLFLNLTELYKKPVQARDANEWKEVIEGLANAERYYLARYFTQFVICNLKAFPALIDHLKKCAQRAISTRKRIY